MSLRAFELGFVAVLLLIICSCDNASSAIENEESTSNFNESSIDHKVQKNLIVQCDTFYSKEMDLRIVVKHEIPKKNSPDWGRYRDLRLTINEI